MYIVDTMLREHLRLYIGRLFQVCFLCISEAALEQKAAMQLKLIQQPLPGVRNKSTMGRTLWPTTVTLKRCPRVKGPMACQEPLPNTGSTGK